MFKRVLLISVFSTLVSCEFLQKNIGAKLSPVSLDTVVDFGKVDQFPAFASCDSILDLDRKNRCFTKELYAHLSSTLLTQTFQVSESINEVVKVKLEIDNLGKSTVVKIEASDLILKQLPSLDSLIRRSVKTMPQLFPAQKRGIPVKTVYEIPIVIQIE